ncbi:MAG: polyamine aminopropyltransferase [Deltaproteobacteria bacterium]|nr:polyamine aminopropyltransferase [Deltaproteobacteria bacterium]
MELWYTERQTDNLGLTLRIKETLCVERTAYQELAVLDTYQYGRMLVLDGAVQITEWDEFIYHEMITHVPLCTHPAPRHVLVVGGGDGGTIRETLKHASVERADLVEIDERVIQVSRQHLPFVSRSLDDPRARVPVSDGISFVKKTRAAYDVILVDSTDPVGPAVGLFAPEFYAAVARALRRDGIFVAQCKSPYLDQGLIRQAFSHVSQVFKIPLLYTAAIPTYPSGYWCFLLGSKAHHPLQFDEPRARALETRYYSPDVHRAAFALPKFVQDSLK